MSNRVVTVSRETDVKPEEHQDKSECCHYWLIDSPNGAISKGICKLCGAEKDFYNSVPEFTLYKRDQKDNEPADSSDQPHNAGQGGD